MTTRRAFPQNYARIDEFRALDFGVQAPSYWNDVTWIGTAGTLALTTIDSIPVLKVTLPIGSTQLAIGVFSGKNFVIPLANWTGDWAVSMYLPDLTATQFIAFIGDSGLANYYSATYLTSNLNRPGWHQFKWLDGGLTGTPTKVGSLTQATAVRAKIRIDKPSGIECVVYLHWCGTPPRGRAQILFSSDDGSPKWYTYVFPNAQAYSMPWAFGLHSANHGALTDANIIEIAGHASGLFKFYSHTTDNNTIAALGTDAYVQAYLTCVAYLRSLGLTNSMLYHPWVGGILTQAGIDRLREQGVTVGRASGSALGNSYNTPARIGADALLDIPLMGSLQSDLTLANAKLLVDSTIMRGNTGIFMAHEFVTAAPAGLQWLESDTTALMAHVAAKRALGLCDTPSIEQWYAGLSGGRRTA